MSVKIKGKIHYNLQEQVQVNKEDIEDLQAVDEDFEGRISALETSTESGYKYISATVTFDEGGTKASGTLTPAQIKTLTSDIPVGVHVTITDSDITIFMTVYTKYDNTYLYTGYREGVNYSLYIDTDAGTVTFAGTSASLSYEELSDKPTIESVELSGNKTLIDLKLNERITGSDEISVDLNEDGDQLVVKLDESFKKEITEIEGNVEALQTGKQDALTGDSEISVKSIEVGGIELDSEVLTDLSEQVEQNKSDINALDTNKQDKLTAGTNITIENNVISASAPDTSIEEGYDEPSSTEVPKIYLRKPSGKAYINESTTAGFYDEEGNILLEWDEAEVDNDCSNIATVIAGISGTVYKIIMGDGVTSIATNAFNGVSINELYVPDNVTLINESAFHGIQTITKIDLPFAGTSITSTDSNRLFGIIFGSTSYDNAVACKQYWSSVYFTTLYVPSTLVDVTIRKPNSTTSANNRIFNTITTIQKLTIVDFPLIGDRFAFNCTALSEFNIVLKNIESYSIGEIILRYTAITTQVFPEGLTSANVNWGMEKLQTLYMLNETPVTQPVASGLEVIANIYVPEDYVQAYKEAWTDLAEIISNGEASAPVYDGIGNEWKLLATQECVSKKYQTKLTRTILWENNNTSVGFSEQDITLNDNYSNYDFIIILFKYSTSTEAYISEEIYIDGSKNYICSENDRIIVQNEKTEYQIVDRLVEFKDENIVSVGYGRYVTFTESPSIKFYFGGSAGNNYFIPYQIIGVK